MGNFSRTTFDALKHYVGVRLQQGVPIVDADWNELEDIRKYELRAFLKWFVGNGVPRGNDGFRVLPVAADNDFAIQGGDGSAEGAGRCMVEGWDVINEDTLNYTAQPLFNNPDLATKWGVDPVPPLTTPMTDRTDVVYVDIWEREVNAEEDIDLVNPAIGIETCVRHKREWVVRVAEGASPPPQSPGHVFYPLASISRKASEPVIGAGDITDLRQLGLNMAALEAEIAAARGIKANLGSRLDASLTDAGELRPGVVGSDQIADDAVNNTHVAPNSLVYDKLRSQEIFDFEIIVTANNPMTAGVGAPDAFRLVSVNVTEGPRDLDWHLKSATSTIRIPNPIPSLPDVVISIPSTLVVLQNNSAEDVTVRVRAYVFSDPG